MREIRSNVLRNGRMSSAPPHMSSMLTVIVLCLTRHAMEQKPKEPRVSTVNSVVLLPREELLTGLLHSLRILAQVPARERKKEQMMTPSHYKIEQFFAGHSQLSGANKYWAAALVEAFDADGASLGWAYTNVYGAVGSIYRVGTKPDPLVTCEQARNDYETNVRRQTAAKKGYVEIAGTQQGAEEFLQFLPFFDITLTMPDALQAPVAALHPATHAAAPPTPERLPIDLPTLKSIPTIEQARTLLEQDRYGAQEKMDGVRCVIWRTATGEVRAYNSSGVLVPTPPSALPLQVLPVECILDGELLTHKYGGRYAGTYAIFGLLSFDRQATRSWSMERKQQVLLDTMIEAGLVSGGAPALSEALQRSLTPMLALVTMTATPREALALLATVEENGGEGVVLRLRAGTDEVARSTQKFKLCPAIDSFVTAIKIGKRAKSVRLGLLRPTDGVVIHLCDVHSGLGVNDVEFIEQELERRVPVVLEITFLLSSTTGISPSQPRTSLSTRRSDKTPRECTTQQLLDLLGEERSLLVQQAKPVASVPFAL